MPSQTKISPFEEALRIMWLQSAKDADIEISERELKLMLSSSDDTFDMDEDKKAALISKLFETVNTPSIGSMVSEAIASKQLELETLTKESEIPVNMLKQLAADDIFPQNVPVVSLGKLLDTLGIRSESAEQPILKTFNIMKAKEYMNLDANACRIAARRQQGERNGGSIGKKGDNKGRELFENRETLDKYLKKLKEIMARSQA